LAALKHLLIGVMVHRASSASAYNVYPTGRT